MQNVIAAARVDPINYIVMCGINIIHIQWSREEIEIKTRVEEPFEVL